MRRNRHISKLNGVPLESMWRLGLTSNEPYPEWPGVPNCVYYMRTGLCEYGGRCRYNHPRDRAAFYLKTGTCKFGASCKFHHPKHIGGSLRNITLNTHGYQLRPGENECSYYLKTGHCKFGITCKFHHPQAADTMTAPAPQFYQPVQSPSLHVSDQYGAASMNLGVRPPVISGSYMPGTYGPVLFSPGVVPIPGWSPYSAPISRVLYPGAQTAVGATSLYRVTQLSATTRVPARPHSSLLSSVALSSSTQKEQTFPERPGEPECQCT